MFEIELINNQPLCEIYDNDVEEILTPSHLLFGGRLELTNFNNSNFNAEAPFLPYRYEHLNTILNHSWKRCSLCVAILLKFCQEVTHRS